MWLYFNQNGELIESLQHGPAARAGSTDYQIFAYFEGVDMIINNFATIKLIKPDLNNSSYPLMPMTQTDMQFVLATGEHSEYFSPTGGANNDGIYRGFLFDFSNFTGDQNAAILLDTPGLWNAIITLYRPRNVFSVQGTATFNVQGGIVNTDGEEVSIDEVLTYFSSAIAGYLPIDKGIVVADNIATLDVSDYEDGQVFLDKASRAMYELDDGDFNNILNFETEVNAIVLDSDSGILDPEQYALIPREGTILVRNGYRYAKHHVDSYYYTFQNMDISGVANGNITRDRITVHIPDGRYEKTNQISYAPIYKEGTLSSTLLELGRYVQVGSQYILVYGTTILKIDDATIYALSIVSSGTENVAHIAIEKLGTYERYDYNISTVYQAMSSYIQATTIFGDLLRDRKDYAVCGEYYFSDDGTKTINELITFLNGVSYNKIIRIQHTVNPAWSVIIYGELSHVFSANNVAHLIDIKTGKFIHFDSSNYLLNSALVSDVFDPDSAYWQEYATASSIAFKDSKYTASVSTTLETLINNVEKGGTFKYNGNVYWFFYNWQGGDDYKYKIILLSSTAPVEIGKYYVTSSAVSKTTTLGQMLTNAQIPATEDYVDTQIADLGNVLEYKGTKTVAQINALTEKEIGDVYNLSDSGTLTDGSISVSSGDNVAWDGTAWDKLASTIDLSGYSHATNMENGTGANSVQQVIDTGKDVDFVNPNYIKSDYQVGAFGLDSIMLGGNSMANNEFTVACGRNTYAGGKRSFACGSKNAAVGNNSVATGLQTCAQGNNGAFTEGNSTWADGESAHAGGRETRARGKYSLAFGYGVVAYSDCQTALGKYSVDTSNALLVVGNGSTANTRSNAFVVYQDGSARVGLMGSSGSSVATKYYVDNGLSDKANNNAVVHLTNDETIYGIKTFDTIKTNNIYGTANTLKLANVDNDNVSVKVELGYGSVSIAGNLRLDRAMKRVGDGGLYGLMLPSTSSLTDDKTIATTDQMPIFTSTGIYVNI